MDHDYTTIYNYYTTINVVYITLDPNGGFMRPMDDLK